MANYVGVASAPRCDRDGGGLERENQLFFTSDSSLNYAHV